MRRFLLSTAAFLLSAQIALTLPAQADYAAAEAALQSGNVAGAIPLLAEEAKLGNPVAAFNLAKIYEDGAAGAPDFTQAATYYRIAAEIDTAPRYNGAALGVQGPQLIAAAQKYGQFALGRLYETGRGVPQDSLEALSWYTRAADLGSTQAMLKLVVIHRDGLPGITPDPARAADWLQRAADTGNIAAMNELGRAYLNGIGVIPNAQEAAKWFEQAAAGGSVVAEYNLGLLYKAGLGGQPDYVRAVEHFERGANAKDAASMLALGDLYAGGQGLPLDKVQAHAWYSLAADYGATEGTGKAAGLAAGMTEQEISAANTLHGNWQPGAKAAAQPAAAPVAPAESVPAAAPAEPAAAVPATAPAPDLPPLFEETAPVAAPEPGVTAPAPILVPEAAPAPELSPPSIPLPRSTPATTTPLLPDPTAPLLPGSQPFEPSLGN
nr:hypothetical protein [uncultured Dongia sp.]